MCAPVSGILQAKLTSPLQRNLRQQATNPRCYSCQAAVDSRHPRLFWSSAGFGRASVDATTSLHFFGYFAPGSLVLSGDAVRT